MQEHEDVTRDMLSKDVAWDAPPIITCDRDDLRVCAYLAKSIAYLTLYPRLVQVSRLHVLLVGDPMVYVA